MGKKLVTTVILALKTACTRLSMESNWAWKTETVTHSMLLVLDVEGWWANLSAVLTRGAIDYPVYPGRSEYGVHYHRK